MASNIDKDTFDMESLLDNTVDMLADTPEFKPFVAGAHRLTLSLAKSDKISEKTRRPEPVIIGKLKLISTEEQADPTEVPMEPGTETQIRFQMDNEFGQGDFKKLAGIISAHFKCQSLNEVLDISKNGIEVLAVTSNRNGKKREDGSIPKFTSIVEMTVL